MVLLLLLSWLGFGLMCIYRFSLKAEFIPVIITSCIMMIMSLAGILNVLPMMVGLITTAGIVLFGYESYHITKQAKWKTILNVCLSPGLWVFMALIIFYAFAMRGSVYMHYDTFSHWGLILKQMNFDHRLPNFLSDVILYPAYPPGTAAYLYYMTRLIGYSQSRAIYAQAILVCAALYSLYAFVPPVQEAKTKAERIKIAVIFILQSMAFFLILSGNTKIFDFTVDTLLSALGVAGAAVIIYYKDRCKEACLYSLPILVCCYLVKISGLFFTVTLLILLLYILFTKGRFNARNASYLALVVVAVISVKYLWDCHVDYAFVNGAATKHSIRLENIQQTIQEKSIDQIKEVTKKFITQSEKNRYSRCVFIWSAAFLGMYLYAQKTKIPGSGKILFTLLGGIAVYALYMAGMLVTYIYSMPYSEARTLSSYYRYLGSGYNFILGCYAICIAKLLPEWTSNISAKTQRICYASLCALFLLFIVWDRNMEWAALTPEQYSGSLIEQFDNVYNSTEMDRLKIAVYYPKKLKYGGTIYHMCKYKAYSPHIETIRNFSYDTDLAEELKDFDYLVVMAEDDKIRALMQPVIEKDDYSGYYKISELWPTKAIAREETTP